MNRESPSSVSGASSCPVCGRPIESDALYCCRGCETIALFQPGGSSPEPRPLPQKWRSFTSEEFCDLYDVADQNSRAADGSRRIYLFFVEGLQCSSCVHLLEKLPEWHQGIRRARISFAESELSVEGERWLTPGDVGALVEALGYPCRPLRPTDGRDDLHRREDRDLLARLGVAGFCAGNLMLTTIPIYAGVGEPWRTGFHWLAFALFLPVLFYSAVPFYRGAWRALKTGRLHVDLPLTLAMWAGFALSTAAIWRGSDQHYFDSTAGFLFLILVSRWLLKKHQRQALRGLEAEDSLLPTVVRAETSEGIVDRPAASLKGGEILVVHDGETLPVDGRLLSDRAVIDSSLMTGEAVPRTYTAGMTVLAGEKNLHGMIRLEAAFAQKESRLQSVLRTIRRQSLQESQTLSAFDRAARILLVTVFSLALLFPLAAPFLGLEWGEALRRSLALIVIACPCALAFGAPLAAALALAEARKKGILVKNADVFERLPAIRDIVFDKTGTLTKGRLKLAWQNPPEIPRHWKEVVLGLEMQSRHPIAFAFREAWSEDVKPSEALRDVHEIAGSRVFGIFDGRMMCLRRSSADPLRLKVALEKDDVGIAEFEFVDELRDGIEKSVQDLQEQCRLHLLSGDTELRAQALGRRLGFSVARIRGGQSPEMKAEYVATLPSAVMIGDGGNDALALSRAAVGIASSGAMDLALRSASVYFLRPGLESLIELRRIALKMKTVNRRNLSFALAYNLAAGSAALCGWVNPLVAALLMPVSSMLIVLSTWRGSR